MKKGKLIVFEGISGTGKETQARLLSAYLTRQKVKTQIVYHPTPDLKTVLSAWRRTRNIDWLTEVYLLLADRSDRVRQVIRPALDRGEWVIGLRNYVSAMVYQAPDGQRQFVEREFRRFEPVPDMLVYFDIVPEKALERILWRSQKTGEAEGKFENITDLARKRISYQTVLKKIDHVSVDAAGSIDGVHQALLKFIEPLLN